eukprot:scaffold5648_cov101-Isochrysis_galbana.AAC.1
MSGSGLCALLQPVRVLHSSVFTGARHKFAALPDGRLARATRKRWASPHLANMLVGYEDSGEEDESEVPRDEPPAPLGLQLPLGLSVASQSSSDEEEETEPVVEGVANGEAQVQAGISVDAGLGGSLPGIDDVLRQVEVPSFLSAPRDDFEHEAFDDRPAAPAPAPAPAAGETAAAAQPARAGGIAAKAAAAAAAAKAKAAAAGGKASAAGKARAKDKEPKDLKERTKEKRKRDQSASFLGGAGARGTRSMTACVMRAVHRLVCADAWRCARSVIDR